MSDEALRRLIEERWTALDVEQAKGEGHLRVAQLPIAPAADPLSVAVDHAATVTSCSRSTLIARSARAWTGRY